MNNLLSYCGLVDAKIRASDKDLPVTTPKPLEGMISSPWITFWFVGSPSLQPRDTNAVFKTSSGHRGCISEKKNVK